MYASVGDRLTIHSTHPGESVRDGEILQVYGENGAPPYVVRWSDNHETLVYPGPDATVHHYEHETV